MIRTAVIGAGHWGPHLVRHFQTLPGSSLAVVVERDAERRKQLQALFPGVTITDDVAPVWADATVEAVAIATPTTTHFTLARAALEAGKHVLVEKPLTTDVASAETLIELARRHRRVLLVGHVFLYNQAVRQVKRYIDEGMLGRIYYLAMTRTNLGPIRADVNAAWDLAAHDIAIANYWLGQEPESVTAMGGTWINPGVEDAVFATLRYPGDVLVNLHASWLHPRKAREIAVVGDKRMLTFDDMQFTEPLRIYDKQVSETPGRPGFSDSFATFRASIRDGDIVIPKVPGGEPLKAECQAFLEAIASGAPPLSGGPEGLAVVRALVALSRSMQAAGRETPVRG